MNLAEQVKEKFPKAKVLVIGDVMLDRYWWGKVSRISPEAPVPIVNLEKTDSTAGGTANVAVNIAGLKAKPILLGIVGKDIEAKELCDSLNKQNVSPEYLISTSERPTTVKTRIVANHQHIVRVDQEKVQFISEKDEELIFNNLLQLIDKIDVIVISDYAKGLLTDNLLRYIIKIANEKNKLILVDPKGKDYQKYKNATILTPNKKEAIEASNISENEDDSINKIGQWILNEYNLNSLLITLGEDGMMLFQRNKIATKFEALARKIYDVTGAGDTVIATLAVALSVGFSLEQSCQIANVAAGLVVEKLGTTSINLDELVEHLQ
ncbi:MAG: D-glycero-beta-D-manno-heptose-7-phosphate kinase [Flavobacterium sp.]|jgi:D-beta-D-heptose 7-phosphate kinase/D-beta-D-heptose 1-phosphate adenosyltransferase|nr:D-glycero-beta-D-manno-heptose-7-phosphate kinase [Flavobacterium sp.]